MTTENITPLKRKSRRSWVIFVVGLWVGVCVGAAGLLILGGLGVIPLGLNLGSSGLVIDPSSPVGVDQPAQDFELENLSGQLIRLSGLQGKVVVVNFWATWCGPCVREMPMFQEYFDRYSPDIVVLGVNMQEPLEEVKSFIEKIGITYEILIDLPGKVGQMYQVFALPNTLFIDREGILRFHHIGVMSEEQLSGYLVQCGIIK